MITDSKIAVAICRRVSGSGWDKIILFLMTVLTRFKRVSESEWQTICEHNKAALALRGENFYKTAPDGRKYVERQREAGKSGVALWYGFQGKEKDRTAIYADYNLCEIIAAVNTLQYFGENVSVGDVALEIGKKGICLGGQFGTAPSAVVSFFRRRGYTCKQYCGSELTNADWKKIQSDSETFIAFCYNDKKSLLGGIHTMSITPQNGRKAYLIHNDYKTYGAVEFKTLKEAVESYDSGRILMLLGISKR